MSRKQTLILIAFLGLIAAFFAFDLGQYLSLSYIKQRQSEFAALYANRSLLVIGMFFVAYVAVTALSLPGAAIMTLAGGAIFGVLVGTLVVSFASSIGATLAFLMSRYVLRDSIQSKFGNRLAEINKGIEKDGAFYLFTLRLVPLIPFFVINLLMGLTRIKTGVFYVASQIGMLAGTLVFVNAGTQLARIDSLRGILSPGLLASFVMLGVFPLIAKRTVEAVQARKVYAKWRHLKPKKFDRNMVVIGAGAAGLVTSYIAAVVKAKVTLVETHKMGGDCLNYGCVPSKALIKSATLISQIRHASDYGVAQAEAKFSLADVMDRIARVVRDIEPHDSIERYAALGVDAVKGYAKITSPWTVEIAQADGTKQTLATRSIVIATGAMPAVPALPGLDQVGYLTSDTLWGLRDLPRRLVVLGGGPIGCELSQSFARLGSQVVQIEMSDRIMVREDTEVSALAKTSLEADGVQVLVQHKALRCELEPGGEKTIVVEAGGVEKRIPFDQLVCAVGRVARLKGFGLEELGVAVGRTVTTNEYLETNFPNILAAGDVAGPYQLTHVAAHQAWYAAVNGLFGMFKKFKADYSVIPWSTFISPEVARVGLNEQEAKEKSVPFEVTRYNLAELDRAIADNATAGFVKVLTVPGKDKILGTIHTYPTLSEANKYAAGEWKRAHQPKQLLAWVEKFQTWRRG